MVPEKQREVSRNVEKKEKEDKREVMIIRSFWCSGHNTSSSLCSSVELIPPTGPEIGMRPKHGQ